MSQNGQTHVKNVAAASRSLKCVWPFWDIIHERVNKKMGLKSEWVIHSMLQNSFFNFYDV